MWKNQKETFENLWLGITKGANSLRLPTRQKKKTHTMAYRDVWDFYTNGETVTNVVYHEAL